MLEMGLSCGKTPLKSQLFTFCVYFFTFTLSFQSEGQTTVVKDGAEEG